MYDLNDRILKNVIREENDNILKMSVKIVDQKDNHLDVALNFLF